MFIYIYIYLSVSINEAAAFDKVQCYVNILE